MAPQKMAPRTVRRNQPTGHADMHACAVCFCLRRIAGEPLRFTTSEPAGVPPDPEVPALTTARAAQAQLTTTPIGAWSLSACAPAAAFGEMACQT
jgi:hypothetical protein